MGVKRLAISGRDPLAREAGTRRERVAFGDRRAARGRRRRRANDPASARCAGVPSSDGSIAAGAGSATRQAALSAATRAALSSTRARKSARASAARTIASNAACWRAAGSRTSRWSHAGLDRAHRQLLDRIAIGDRLHAEIVGDDHAAEAELAAQQLGRDPARQRRRPIGIERRIEHVRGHERLHAGARGRRERRQLHGAQALDVVRDDRQLEVRIGRACRRARGSACRSRPGRRRAARARTPAPARATASGVVPNARLPMTGLAGLVCTSSTGAKSQPTPSAASSSPSARPTAGRARRVAAAADRQHRRPDRGRRAHAAAPGPPS